jgi:hypothetical protein
MSTMITAKQKPHTDHDSATTRIRSQVLARDHAARPRPTKCFLMKLFESIFLLVELDNDYAA